MNIQNKDYTVQSIATKINYIELVIRQDINGTVTAAGKMELLDANGGVVKEILQPLTQAETTKLAQSVAGFKTWFLQQNGITTI